MSWNEGHLIHNRKKVSNENTEQDKAPLSTGGIERSGFCIMQNLLLSIQQEE